MRLLQALRSRVLAARRLLERLRALRVSNGSDSKTPVSVRGR